MPQTAAQRRIGHARLIAVNFPRVEIEHCRAQVDTVNPFDRPAAETIGQHPEKAAAARRHPPISQLHGGDGNFHQRAIGQRLKGKARRGAPAIMIMCDRRDA